MTNPVRVLARAAGNPVFSREARASVRSPRTAMALAGYLAAVAAGACVLFSLAAVGSPDHSPGTGQLERVAYHAMAFQVVLVAFVAPVLGAVAITGEREEGTFDTLTVGALRPRSILTAKLMASTAVVALFAVAAFPLYVVVFLHSGLGIGQLVVAEVLTLATAMAGISLGLLASALSPSTPIAVLAACALALALCLDIVLSGSVPAPASGLAQTRSQLLTGRFGLDTTELVTDEAGRPVALSREDLLVNPVRLANPLYALHFEVTKPEDDGIPVGRLGRQLVPGGKSFSTWGVQLKPWQVSASAAAALSVLCLLGASRFTVRPPAADTQPDVPSTVAVSDFEGVSTG